MIKAILIFFILGSTVMAKKGKTWKQIQDKKPSIYNLSNNLKKYKLKEAFKNSPLGKLSKDEQDMFIKVMIRESKGYADAEGDKYQIYTNEKGRRVYDTSKSAPPEKHSYGLFQIRGVNLPFLKTKMKIDNFKELKDPAKNMEAAYHLYVANGFQPWGNKMGGSVYKKNATPAYRKQYSILPGTAYHDLAKKHGLLQVDEKETIRKYGKFSAPVSKPSKPSKPKPKADLNNRFLIPEDKSQVQPWMKKHGYKSDDLKKSDGSWYHPGEIIKPEVNPINKQLEDMEEWDSYEREFDAPPKPEFEAPPKPEFEIPVDQSVPYGVYDQGQPEFVEAEQAKMWAAKGGEVKKYDNGGEVVDEYEDSWMRDYEIESTPEYLRSPEYRDEPVEVAGVPGYVPQEQTEEEKKAEFAELYKPHEGSRWGGEQFRDPTGMGASFETESMVEVDDEGQETVLEEEKDVVEEVGKGVSGSWEEEKVVDKEVTTQDAPAKTLPKLSRKDFLEIRELQDEKKLREAEDEAIALAQKQSQIDPKRFYKNMGTFNKVVSLVALAAGAYGAYKHGGPNLYIKQLDDAVKKDIEEQKLGQVQEARKLAAANFKIATLSKRLARSTTNLNRSQNFENLALKYQQKGVKEVKKQEKKRRDVATLAQLNTRGVTDNELAYLSVNFPKMKIENQVIKGRDGLNYYIKGGTSRANKVKEYVANAQQTVDGLNDLMGYVDKVQLWEQGDFNPVGALFSQDRAEAQSLRDRLVGNLRIEFFGPGVMTDQEREQAKKILGDPNRLLTSDSREKAKINNLMMKVNYGVRQKLRSDGVALPVSPNERKIAQMLKRRKLANVPVNRRKVVDQLIFEEKKWVKKGGTPGKWWDPNEPLAI